ncbi:hypothetical protein AB7254_17710 [Providencia rettgeri]
MSYYNTKQECHVLFVSNSDEKKLFQTLAYNELKTHSTNAETHILTVKANLTGSKRHSSATLLRKKLKGRIERDLCEL